MSGSGYVNCACDDCFEVAIGDKSKEVPMCISCEEAGCEVGDGCLVVQEDCDDEDWEGGEGGESHADE